METIISSDPDCDVWLLLACFTVLSLSRNEWVYGVNKRGLSMQPWGTLIRNTGLEELWLPAQSNGSYEI